MTIQIVPPSPAAVKPHVCPETGMTLASYDLATYRNGQKEIITTWSNPGTGTEVCCYQLDGRLLPALTGGGDFQYPPRIPQEIVDELTAVPVTANGQGDRLVVDRPYSNGQVRICDTVERENGRFIRCRKHGRHEMVVEKPNGGQAVLMRCPAHAEALRDAFGLAAEEEENVCAQTNGETVAPEPAPLLSPATREKVWRDTYRYFRPRDEGRPATEEEKAAAIAAVKAMGFPEPRPAAENDELGQALQRMRRTDGRIQLANAGIADEEPWF